MTSINEFTVPVELHVGDVSAEVAQLTVTSDPAVWRPRLANLLRSVATEVEIQEDEPDDE